MDIGFMGRLGGERKARRIRKGGRMGEELSDQSVRLIVKERCALAGVEGRVLSPLAAIGLRDRGGPP